MEKHKLIKDISNEINNTRNVNIDLIINNIPYNIRVLTQNYKKGISIPSIILIPKTKNINNQIVMESNNLESDDLEELLKQAAYTGTRLAKLTSDMPTPIVIPILPSYKDKPYFQQLSKECFLLSNNDRNYRIDEQVLRVLEQARGIIEEETGIKTRDKIFLNGYSSSGVFAQRFSLLHPELIDVACIGGASGSIPIPSIKIGYPIGVEDYEELFGKEFNMQQYKSIKFRYYVGELETANKTKARIDDEGNPAPMHDMSYFDRSVPTNIGVKQRKALGQKMFDRVAKSIAALKNIGIDIEHTIIPGRAHNNRSGIGVNELGDKFINDIYKETIIRNKNIGAENETR